MVLPIWLQPLSKHQLLQMQFWFRKGAWASKKAHDKISHIEPQTIKSIAVIRHAALGDMILTRPFFVEVKKAFPNALVTISVLDHYMRGIPNDLVDRVHIVYKKTKRQFSLREKINNLLELGNHDIIFDLSDTSRSILLCLLNKAKIKIGFPYRFIYRYFLYDTAIYRTDFTFETDVILHTLNLLGFKTSFPPQFQVTQKPSQRDSPYIVYFTGASTKLKCWSLEKFKQLILKMSKEYPGYDHIVLKGITDWESISEIFKGLGKESNILSAEIDELEETISFIKGARMLVSNDTGIRHVAIASQTPSVGIFLGTVKGVPQQLFRYWPRYGQHDIVYNLDGTEPTVEKVFKTIEMLIVQCNN